MRIYKPRWLHETRLWERVVFTLKVIYYCLFHKRRVEMYYFYRRLPFKQTCYICHKEHVVESMEDPTADVSSCMECFEDETITEEVEQAARARCFNMRQLREMAAYLDGKEAVRK